MLDPRIYRTSLVAVLAAVIVFAFALQGQPQPLGTSIAPDAFSGQNAFANMVELAHAYPDRAAGSAHDRALAGLVAARLRHDGFAVSEQRFRGPTPAGTRTLENVVAVRQGLQSPAIVVVAHRDAVASPARAELSGTAVLLDLGRALSGETLNHTIVLASTTGSTGAVGAAQLAQQLGRPVDAVLVLGDMAGTTVRRPLVVPWSSGQQLAPALLRNTVAAALGAQAGMRAGSPGLASQLAHLAFPLTVTEQAPFILDGIPAVLLSTSGDRPPSASQRVSLTHLSRFGRAALETIDALDSNPRVPSAQAYLSLDGKEIPAWAVRLLALALILPVAATALDAFARARRRGHVAGGRLLWIGAAATPFLAALAIVSVAHAADLLPMAPPGAVAPGAVPLHTGGGVLLGVLAAVVVLGLALLGAQGGLRALAGRGRAPAAAERESGDTPTRRRAVERTRTAAERRRGAHVRAAATVGDPGTATAILLWGCVLALAVWAADPFAALLLVPALHLWMVALVPQSGVRPSVRLVLFALGLVAPALLFLYYALALGYGPLTLAWTLVLMVAGGQLSVPAAVLMCLLAGCAVCAAVSALGAATARAQSPAATPVTVRGPVTYAGPGSLGGTSSALPPSGQTLKR